VNHDSIEVALLPNRACDFSVPSSDFKAVRGCLWLVPRERGAVECFENLLPHERVSGSIEVENIRAQRSWRCVVRVIDDILRKGRIILRDEERANVQEVVGIGSLQGFVERDDFAIACPPFASQLP